jgi:hypothetical protein
MLETQWGGDIYSLVIPISPHPPMHGLVLMYVTPRTQEEINAVLRIIQAATFGMP